MNTAQKAVILAALLAIGVLFLLYKPAEPVVIVEEPAVEKIQIVEQPVVEKPAQIEKPKPKLKCSSTIISPTGKLCYAGTAAENNNFIVTEEHHIGRDVCTLFSIYPLKSKNENLAVKISINASEDLDTYIVDNYNTSFDRCSHSREPRYIKFYNLDNPVKDELTIYPNYYLLFETNKNEGSDVKFSIDYSSNIREQCGCEE